MNSILIGLLLAGLGAGGSWYYRQEAINAKIFYDGQIASIEKKSATERKLSEDHINGIQAQRLIDKKAADNRIQQLSRKLARPAVTSCSTSLSGVISANIDDSVIGVLREAVDDNRISKTNDPASHPSSP